MQGGEWWIDEDGHTTFADGDVGEYNHEMLAFYAALNIGEDDGFNPNDVPFNDEQVEALRELGANEQAIQFFRKRNADARDYALKFMGWIRVKGRNVQCFNFDDRVLQNLRNAEFWDEEDENDSETEVWVEEMSTGWNESIPISTLLKAQSAAGLKNWISGAGKWHRSEMGDSKMNADPIIDLKWRAHSGDREALDVYLDKMEEAGRITSDEREGAAQAATNWFEHFVYSYLVTAIGTMPQGRTGYFRASDVDRIANRGVAIADCTKFIRAAQEALTGWDAGLAAHNFWLTRNRHGTGFWDHEEPGSKLLDQVSKTFPETYIYEADGGRLYFPSPEREP